PGSARSHKLLFNIDCSQLRITSCMSPAQNTWESDDGPPDEADDRIERSSRLEYCRNPLFLQFFRVLVGDNPAHHHLYVRHFVLPQQLEHPRNDRVMGS